VVEEGEVFVAEVVVFFFRFFLALRLVCIGGEGKGRGWFVRSTHGFGRIGPQ